MHKYNCCISILRIEDGWITSSQNFYPSTKENISDQDLLSIFIESYVINNKDRRIINLLFKGDISKETNLTVSGQLEAESMALGLGKVYTFGPTFRAENSNTSRNLAEFWMIEPEMAFYELDDNINLAEQFIKYIIKYVYDKCKNEKRCSTNTR